MGAERIAAIDIGTVTTRLLVADVDDTGVTECVRRSVITHLGEGWTATGVLSEDGIGRVGRAVEAFVAEAHDLGARSIIAMATSAARDAANGPAFLDRIERSGVRPEIIAGEREGYLSFLGATSAMSGEGIMVVDVGGGSTEIVVGDVVAEGTARSIDVRAVRSIDVGSRRITERFLRTDPPTAREIDEAAGWAADELRPFFNALKVRPREMVSVAGTATSIAAIELVLDPYDAERIHGHRVQGAVLVDILEHLAVLPLAERKRVVGLEPERAGVIVGGLLILQMVLALSGLASTVVSEHDILYGMVLDQHATGVREP